LKQPNAGHARGSSRDTQRGILHGNSAQCEDWHGWNSRLGSLARLPELFESGWIRGPRLFKYRSEYSEVRTVRFGQRDFAYAVCRYAHHARVLARATPGCAGLTGRYVICREMNAMRAASQRDVEP